MRTQLQIQRVQHDSTVLSSIPLAGNRGWHQDKESHGLYDVLVYNNNLPCSLSTPSITYSYLVFEKYWSILFLIDLHW